MSDSFTDIIEAEIAELRCRTEKPEADCAAWEKNFREVQNSLINMKDERIRPLAARVAEAERAMLAMAAVVEHATGTVTRLHRQRDALAEALREISKGAGPFDRDPLKHAENCIDDMKALAKDALVRLDASKENTNE